MAELKKILKWRKKRFMTGLVRLPNLTLLPIRVRVRVTDFGWLRPPQRRQSARSRLAARVLLARSWTMFSGVSAWWRGTNVPSSSVGNDFGDGDAHVAAGADADVRAERDEDNAAAVADGIGAGRGFDRATAAGIDARLNSSSSSSSSASASSTSDDDDVATPPVALPGVSPEDDVAAPPVALREDDAAAEGGEKRSYAKNL